MLKITSLNIQHGENLARVRSFLKNLKADVMLMQEVRYCDVFDFAQRLGIKGTGVAYAPISLLKSGEHIEKIGLAILSHLPLHNIRHCNLLGRSLTSPSEKRIHRRHIQENLLCATVEDAQGHVYRLATTHLDVTHRGEVTEKQERSVTRLLRITGKEARDHGGLLLAGDFNAPRGRDSFDRIAGVFTDNVPPQCTTTIDNTLHSVKDTPQRRIDFVVDGVFTQGYRVEDFHHEAGVSDHLAARFELHPAP